MRYKPAFDLLYVLPYAFLNSFIFLMIDPVDRHGDAGLAVVIPFMLGLAVGLLLFLRSAIALGMKLRLRPFPDYLWKIGIGIFLFEILSYLNFENTFLLNISRGPTSEEKVSFVSNLIALTSVYGIQLALRAIYKKFGNQNNSTIKL